MAVAKLPSLSGPPLVFQSMGQPIIDVSFFYFFFVFLTAALKSEAAATGTLKSSLLASETSGLNLNYKVPAASHSDIKAAGYLTILDGTPTPPK